MNLQFDYLELTKFKSFIQPCVLKLHDCGVGLHFLRGQREIHKEIGSNGCGKSSLWDSLSWCLFGRTPDGRRGPDVRSWHGKGATTVTVGIHIDDKQHKITRTANPNSLTLNGKECGQEHIEQLIGLDVEVFYHTILLPQDKPLFFDLTPSQKMKVFTDVLHLDKWDARTKLASDKTTIMTAKHLDLRNKVHGLQNTLKEVTALHDNNKAKAEEYERNRRTYTQGYQKEIDGLTKELDVVQLKQSNADLALDSASTEARALNDNINKLSDAIHLTTRAHAQHKARLDALNNEYEVLAKELAEPPGMGTCPTCDQPLTKLGSIQHIDQRMKEIDEEARSIDLKKFSTAKLELELTRARAAAKEFLQKADKAEAERKMYSDKVNALQIKLSGLQASMKRDESQDNPYRAQVRDLRNRRDALDNEITETEATLTKLARNIERVKFWIKGFKEVQLFIVQEVLDELELVSNGMLPDVGLEDWELHYAIEKETQSGTVQRHLNVTVLSPDNKKPVRWECWSGGEKQRLRLIGALALSEVLLNHAGIVPSMEVVDEPTKNLSDEGVRDLCEFLAMRAKQIGRQVFLTDHATQPSSHFASMITITKTAKGSHIEP